MCGYDTVCVGLFMCVYGSVHMCVWVCSYVCRSVHFMVVSVCVYMYVCGVPFCVFDDS